MANLTVGNERWNMESFGNKRNSIKMSLNLSQTHSGYMGKKAGGFKICEPFHISFFGEDILTRESGVYWYSQVLKTGKP